jgi:hypothetical protein
MCARNICSRWLKDSSSGRVCTLNFLAMLRISSCSFFSLSQTTEPKERLSRGNKSYSSLLKCSLSDSAKWAKSIALPQRSPTSNFRVAALKRSKSRVIALCSFVSRTVRLESLSVATLSSSHKHRVCELNSHGWRSPGVSDSTKTCSSRRS